MRLVESIYKNLNESDNYEPVKLCDSQDNDVVYKLLGLNLDKYSIKDFQNAIYDAKEKHWDEIEEYGDDWDSYIQQELDDFDYIELDETDYDLDDIQEYVEY